MPETDSKQDNKVLTRKSAVRAFLDLQSSRVEAYNLLNRSFEDYLKSAPQYNFDQYKSIVHTVTERFNEISSEIIKLISFLEANKDCEQIVRYMKSVQEHEAEKLSLTRDLQIQRKSVTDEEGYEDQLEEIKKRMQATNERITTVLEDFKYEAEDILTS